MPVELIFPIQFYLDRVWVKQMGYYQIPLERIQYKREVIQDFLNSYETHLKVMKRKGAAEK